MLHSESIPTTKESDEKTENYAIKVLATKCIHDHRHPIVKVCLPPNKLFFAARNDEEKTLIRDYQDQFVSILEHQRVEKRCSRAQAIWLVDRRIAKVIKIVKNLLKYFGYQNKEGVFLHPEEMLYLLETNRLEVTCDDTSLAVEKAYELVLKTSDVNLTKYRVYKKLANLGYKLIRFNQRQLKTSHKIKASDAKRMLEDLSSPEESKCKKSKPYSAEGKDNESEINHSSAMSSNRSEEKPSVSKEIECISNIFNQLRKNMPSNCVNKTESTNPDYYVWSPPNTLKTEPDYNLFICDGNITDKKDFSSDIPNIYALCIDDVSFYRFGDVCLPHI